MVLFLVACAPETEPKTDDVSVPSTAESTNTVDTMSLDRLTIFPSFADFEPLLQKNNDTTYVVNFWATWCKPCVAEMPYFEELHDKFSNEAFKMIMVTLDFPKAYERQLIPFINKRNLRPEVVALADGDYDSWIDRVNPDWGGEIPATVIYRGKQRDFYATAFHSTDELEEAIRAVMD